MRQLRLPVLWTLGISHILRTFTSTAFLDLVNAVIGAVGSPPGALVVVLFLVAVVVGGYLIRRKVLDNA